MGNCQSEEPFFDKCPPPKQVITAARNDDNEFMQEFVDSYPHEAKDANYFMPCMKEAIKHQNKLIGKLFCKAGIDVDRRDEAGLTLMMICAQANAVQIMKYLAKRDSNVNATGYWSWTALHYAAANCNLEALEFLLDNGADPNMVNMDGFSPLLLVINSTVKKDVPLKEAMVKALLDKGADPNIVEKKGTSPLHAAILRTNVKIALLLMDHNANIHAVESNKGNSILHMACMKGKIDIVVRLLVQDIEEDVAADGLADTYLVDMNLQNNAGMTALMICAYYGGPDHDKIAERLLDAGADWNVLDTEHRSAYVIAAEQRNLGILDIVPQSDADILDPGLAENLRNAKAERDHAQLSAKIQHEKAEVLRLEEARAEAARVRQEAEEERERLEAEQADRAYRRELAEAEEAENQRLQAEREMEAAAMQAKKERREAEEARMAYEKEQREAEQAEAERKLAEQAEAEKQAALEAARKAADSAAVAKAQADLARAQQELEDKKKAEEKEKREAEEAAAARKKEETEAAEAEKALEKAAIELERKKAVEAKEKAEANEALRIREKEAREAEEAKQKLNRAIEAEKALELKLAAEQQKAKELEEAARKQAEAVDQLEQRVDAGHGAMKESLESGDLEGLTELNKVQMKAIPEIKQGQMLKKGDWLNQMKRRQFVLEKGELKFYEMPLDHYPYGDKFRNSIKLNADCAFYSMDDPIDREASVSSAGAVSTQSDMSPTARGNVLRTMSIFQRSSNSTSPSIALGKNGLQKGQKADAPLLPTQIMVVSDHGRDILQCSSVEERIDWIAALKRHKLYAEANMLNMDKQSALAALGSERRVNSLRDNQA